MIGSSVKYLLMCLQPTSGLHIHHMYISHAAIECTATTVTVTDVPSSISTFDPCLYILPKTSSSSVPFTSSAMLSDGPPTSTHIQKSTTSTVEITSSSVLPTSINIQRNTSSTIGHISPSTSTSTKITSSSVYEHTSINIQRNTSSTVEDVSSTSSAPTISVSSADQQTSIHIQRTTSSIIGLSVSPSSSAPSKITSSSVDHFEADTTTTVIAGTSTLHVLRSSDMSVYHHVSPTVTSYTADVTPTSYSELPSSTQPDSTRTSPTSSVSEEPMVSTTTATGEIMTTEEALQPKSSSSQLETSSLVPFPPDVTIPEIVSTLYFLFKSFHKHCSFFCRILKNLEKATTLCC